MANLTWLFEEGNADSALMLNFDPRENLSDFPINLVRDLTANMTNDVVYRICVRTNQIQYTPKRTNQILLLFSQWSERYVNKDGSLWYEMFRYSWQNVQMKIETRLHTQIKTNRRFAWENVLLLLLFKIKR